MPKSRAEHLGAIKSLPTQHIFVLALLSINQGLRGFINFYVVIELFRDGAPVAHAFRNRVSRIHKCQGNRFLGAVSSRIQPVN